MKCPHCLVSFHDSWSRWFWDPTDVGKVIAFDRETGFGFSSTTCPSCKKLIFELNQLPRQTPSKPSSKEIKTIVYPKASARPVADEVDEKFATDFREACLVIGDSEKASAALSRRCLQNLLREKAGTTAKDLAKQIQEVLDSGKLPSHLGEAIDAVRAIGNFAAHPVKSTSTGEVIDVEPGEAEWNLDTLEGLFDFYFVQPAQLAKKRDALNKKLKDAGKPPLKEP